MTTMSVRTFFRVIPKLPANTSVLLRGNHGIGKSQVVRTAAGMIAAAESIADFEVIDRRLSQMSEGDMIGLPSTDGETTRFNPPDWFKRACKKPCCLFLDELNRATPEVMQAAFQIVLDRELNGWKLHPQTRVFSAINSSAQYSVNEVDPALLDRFFVLDLNPDTQDWVDWARGAGKVAASVVDFIVNQDKWLDPPKSHEPGIVTPSRRSWEKLSLAHQAAGIADEPNHELFYPMCLGFVGTEATIAYHSFAKSIDNRITGAEILNDYKKVKVKIGRLGQERLNIAIDKVAEYIEKNVEKTITDKQGENLKQFMKDLPGELRIAAWSKLTKHGIDKLELAKTIHKYCAAEVLDVFGVPMGEAGIGVVPNVPGIFQAGAKKEEPATAKKKK